MHISSFLSLVTLVAAFPQRRDSLDPLLTSIGKVSDLSTFYSLFEGTGGDSGKSGPDFEERFNDPNNNLQFTALAPTNEASIYKSILIAQTNFEGHAGACSIAVWTDLGFATATVIRSFKILPDQPHCTRQHK